MKVLMLAAALAAPALSLVVASEADARPRVIDHRRWHSPPRPQPPRHSPPRPGYRYGGPELRAAPVLGRIGPPMAWRRR